MREVLVGSGRDVTGVPLPVGAPTPVPASVASAEGTVLTAFLTAHGEYLGARSTFDLDGLLDHI